MISYEQTLGSSRGIEKKKKHGSEQAQRGPPSASTIWGEHRVESRAEKQKGGGLCCLCHV